MSWTRGTTPAQQYNTTGYRLIIKITIIMIGDLSRCTIVYHTRCARQHNKGYPLRTRRAVFLSLSDSRCALLFQRPTTVTLIVSSYSNRTPIPPLDILSYYYYLYVRAVIFIYFCFFLLPGIVNVLPRKNEHASKTRCHRVVLLRAFHGPPLLWRLFCASMSLHWCHWWGGGSESVVRARKTYCCPTDSGADTVRNVYVYASKPVSRPQGPSQFFSLFQCWFNKLIAFAPTTVRGSKTTGLFGLDGWSASRFLGTVGDGRGERWDHNVQCHRTAGFHPSRNLIHRAWRFIVDSEAHLSCPLTAAGIRLYAYIWECVLNVNIFHYLRRRLVWAVSCVLCLYGYTRRVEGRRHRVFLCNIFYSREDNASFMIHFWFPNRIYNELKHSLAHTGTTQLSSRNHGEYCIKRRLKR